MKILAQKIGALGVIVMMLGSLTGCTSVFSLPHDERYQYINQVMDEVDYTTAGTIVEEQIDDGDGVFEPSWKEVYYKEKSAYQTLVDRMEDTPAYNCSGGETQFSCTRGPIQVVVSRLGEEGKETYLAMNDSSGGRS